MFNEHIQKANEICEVNAFRVHASLDLSALKDKKVLITGVTGLIGFNLYNVLWRAGAYVFGTCRGPCPVLMNIQSMSQGNTIWGEMDYIIHAAGYASPSVFTKYEFETIALNTTYLQSLITSLKPGATLLYLSSSELYTGAQDFGKKYVESDIGQTTPEYKRAAYIEGKRCGEALCHAARRVGKNVKIARVSSAYGPGSKVGDTRVLNSFIQEGIRQNGVVVRGNPYVFRSFCYISDVAEMLLNIMLTGRSDVYNVGSEELHRITEVAKLVAETLKVRFTIADRIDGAISTGPGNVHISMRKYQDEFPNGPATPFEQGLKETVEWYQSLMDTENLSNALST